MNLFRRWRPVPNAVVHHTQPPAHPPVQQTAPPFIPFRIRFPAYIPGAAFDAGSSDGEFVLGRKPSFRRSKDGQHYYDSEEEGLYSSAESVQTDASEYTREVNPVLDPDPNPIVDLLRRLRAAHLVRRGGANDDAPVLQDAPAAATTVTATPDAAGVDAIGRGDTGDVGTVLGVQSTPLMAILTDANESNDDDLYDADLDVDSDTEADQDEPSGDHGPQNASPHAQNASALAQNASPLAPNAPFDVRQASSFAQLAHSRNPDEDTGLELSFSSERFILKPKTPLPSFPPETIGSNSIQFEWLLRELCYGHYIRDEARDLRFLRADMKPDLSRSSKTLHSLKLTNPAPEFPKKKKRWYKWLQKTKTPYEGELFNPSIKLTANRSMQEEVSVTITRPVSPTRVITKETEFFGYDNTKCEISKNGLEIRHFNSHKAWNNLKFFMRHADVASPKKMKPPIKPLDINLAFDQCHRAYLAEEWHRLQWATAAYSENEIPRNHRYPDVLP